MPPRNPRSPTAADIMTPSPRTCSVFSTVLEAVLLFKDADCGAVPVLEEGKAVGILTDRDVALALADHDAALPSLPVSASMARNPVTVPCDADLDTIVEQFGESRVRRLLVVDASGQLAGIIGWADVAPHVSDREIGRAVSEVVSPP